MRLTFLELNLPALQNSTVFWPGLGGTDEHYAWTLVAYSLTEAAVIPIVVMLANRVAFTLELILVVCMYAISGAVYALAVKVWMVILARAIMGGAGLVLSVTVHTYVSEMGTLIDRTRKKNGKVAVYAAFLL